MEMSLALGKGKTTLFGVVSDFKINVSHILPPLIPFKSILNSARQHPAQVPLELISWSGGVFNHKASLPH